MAIKHKNRKIKKSINNRKSLISSNGLTSFSDSGQDKFGKFANSGIDAFNLGHYDEAINFYQEAIALNPMAFELYFNIGVAHNNMGRLEDAINYYRKAINLKPDLTGAYNNMGHALIKLDRPGPAVACFRKTLTLKPSNSVSWQNFVKALSKIPIAESSHFKDDFKKCLDKEDIHLGLVSNHLIALVKQHPDFQSLLELTEHDNLESLFNRVKSGSALHILDDPFLTALLESDIVVDSLIEKFLTCIRKILLQLAIDGEIPEAIAKIILRFSIALAHQCFINEYAYFKSEAEEIWINTLYRRIKAEIDSDHFNSVFSLSLLAAYAPLYSYEKLSSKIILISESTGNPDFNSLVQRQVAEPAAEMQLIAEISTLTKVADKVSQAVRNQYEENPYPRWIKTPHIIKRKLGEAIVRLFPQIEKIRTSIPDSPRILIAGCGTGQQAVVCAMRYANCKILAFDISKRSLAYAMRKAHEMNIGNIEFAHGDILELGEFDRHFDVILSTGVLHHLSNPVEGLRLLTNLLNSGGFFKIGLYSEIARRHIIAARKFIAQQGYGSSPDDIRKCRQKFLDLDDNSQLNKICEYVDFYSLSMCRDLLFHVQEHRFNLIQVKEAIEDIGLEFLGFEMPDSNAITQYKSQNYYDPDATSLELWHRYELDHPDSFLGMYQFWTRKR